ncbi:hypothetical protein BJ165DRAFT_1464114 [Panaeolus papilionaceus]|nr:hypothetical protein BJ165DRAFT_1464114 [Panaeolus papilionaceus]
MPQDLRQRRRGSRPRDPGEPPPANTGIEPLLSTLDELRLTINTLSEQSQLQLQDELQDILQKLQTPNHPPPPTQPQSTPPISTANSDPTSGPSKIGIFGGQVTFVNTVHNGDDAERAKHSVSLHILALLSVLQLGPTSTSSSDAIHPNRRFFVIVDHNLRYCPTSCVIVDSWMDGTHLCLSCVVICVGGNIQGCAPCALKTHGNILKLEP